MSIASNTPAIVVLKFGSSVLRTAQNLPSVVSEIYRHVRMGEHVIAVVSAFAGETDRILAACRAWTPEPNAYALATAVATGEMDSATQLVFALERAGIPVSFLDPRDVNFRTRGPRLDAGPDSIDVIRLRQLVEQSPVTVMPGFYALAEGHGIALLGRGGSDLTAVYVAERLGCRCILVKDVDGLCESDPAQGGVRPRRFERAHYDDAVRLGSALIQPKAIERARAANRSIEIRAVGERDGTLIANEPSHLVASRQPKRLRVFLLGLGTVGGGMYDFLAALPDRYEITGILVRDASRHAAAGILSMPLLTDPVDALRRILATDTDVVIETLGGTDPAHALVVGALAAGRHVITANKELIAPNWDDFEDYLEARSPRLRCSAAVGGAVPMMELVQRLVASGERIQSVRGVVNGTCNYILDQIADGTDFDAAVRDAQAKGLTEPDATADLSGADAARKIEILCRLAFGAPPARLDVHGLSTEAVTAPALPDTTCRLVATLDADRVGCVALAWLTESDFLAHARGAENRLEVTTTDGAVHRLSGLGAGRYPTATAILADLLDISLARPLRHGRGPATATA